MILLKFIEYKVVVVLLLINDCVEELKRNNDKYNELLSNPLIFVTTSM